MIFNQTRRLGSFRPLSLFEAIVRDVMDFGFGSLLEKFEEYFGKRVTAGLMILLGMAIATGCVRIILTAVLPVIKVIYPILTGPSAYIVPLLATSTGLSLGALVGYAIYVRIKDRQEQKEIDAITDQIDATTTRLNVAIQKGQAALPQSQQDTAPKKPL